MGPLFQNVSSQVVHGQLFELNNWASDRYQFVTKLWYKLHLFNTEICQTRQRIKLTETGILSFSFKLVRNKQKTEKINQKHSFLKSNIYQLITNNINERLFLIPLKYSQGLGNFHRILGQLIVQSLYHGIGLIGLATHYFLMENMHKYNEYPWPSRRTN